MPNKKSVEKSFRKSLRKGVHNVFWKDRVGNARRAVKKALETKGVEADILKEQVKALQKVLDKAVKAGVVHRNKANRLKSRYAKKTAQTKTRTKSKS